MPINVVNYYLIVIILNGHIILLVLYIIYLFTITIYTMRYIMNHAELYSLIVIISIYQSLNPLIIDN